MKNFLLKSDYVNNKGFLEKIALGDIFEFLSSYEDKANKDYAEFKSSEIDKFLDAYTAETKTSKKLVEEALNKYSIWYRAQKMLPDICEEDLEGIENKVDNLIGANDLNNTEDREVEKGEEKTDNRLKSKKTEFNPDRYISEEELNEYCNNLESPFNRLLIRSIYEGFDFSEDGHDIVKLKLEDCDVGNNIVTFSSGRQMEVSDKLMRLLTECAELEYIDSESINGNHNILKEQIAEEDINRCFKILPIENDLRHLNDLIKARIYRIKIPLNNSKLSVSNLFCSGYLTELKKTGLESGFNIMKNIKIEERLEILAKYKMLGMLPGNYKRKINVYLKEAE